MTDAVRSFAGLNVEHKGFALLYFDWM